MTNRTYRGPNFSQFYIFSWFLSIKGPIFSTNGLFGSKPFIFVFLTFFDCIQSSTLIKFKFDLKFEIDIPGHIPNYFQSNSKFFKAYLHVFHANTYTHVKVLLTHFCLIFLLQYATGWNYLCAGFVRSCVPFTQLVIIDFLIVIEKK